MIEFTPEQVQAIDAVDDWFRTSPEQVYRLGGFAGTGKSECVKEIRRRLAVPAALCAFTGKAVSVLHRKGNYSASTIHSLIYQPPKEEQCVPCRGKGKHEGGRKCSACAGTGIKEEMIWQLKPALTQGEDDEVEIALVIVDEASMVDGNLWSDLLSFGVKVLAVGDPGQLEPIGNDPRLMSDPDFTLETIHRQAEGDPILDLATSVRHGAFPMGECVVSKAKARTMALEEFDRIICGYNRTRHRINADIRFRLGKRGQLEVGDHMICLRNNRDAGVFNGLGGVVQSIDDEDERVFQVSMLVDGCERPRPVTMLKRQIGVDAFKYQERIPWGTTLWDYGYALTAHKSQGSEWGNVLVVEEIWKQKWDAKRWRYTAITRASERLVYAV